MRVYFTASISGKDKYEKNYTKIYELIERLGYKQVSRHVLATSYAQVKDATDRELVKYYEKTIKNISSCDFLVAEVSHPTIGVGYEISLAIEKSKPVIVLLVEGSLTPQILKAVPSGNVKTIKYTLENLENVLPAALNNLKRSAPIRFNFFISPEINQYLDWIAKVKRIPRAVYLRELVEREMGKSKEFNK